MKRLISLFILTWCFCTTLSAQNTTSLPAGTTSVTLAPRMIGTDSLRSLWLGFGIGYNQVYTATQTNKNFKTKADSLSATGGYVTHFALLDSLKNKQTKISGQDFAGSGITGNPIRIGDDTAGTGRFIVRRANGYLGYDNTHYYSSSDTTLIATRSYALAHGGGTSLSGNGFVKVTGTTVSYDNSTYLTTTSAASTYQPLLTAGLGFNITGSTAKLDTAQAHGAASKDYLAAFAYTKAQTLAQINSNAFYFATGTFTHTGSSGDPFQLGVSTSPTSGSALPLTSGGAYTAFQNYVTIASPQLTTSSTINYIWTATDSAGHISNKIIYQYHKQRSNRAVTNR